jgi:hypothetical protein
MARATDAHGQADPGGDAPNEETEEAPRVAVALGPATADANTGETAGIPVAGTGALVVQTRDPYHGVRDRGQCEPAARAVRRCRASPNYLRIGQQALERPVPADAPGECTIQRATACHAKGTAVSPSANTLCLP